MKAVRVHEFGGPEVLVYEDAPDPVPGEGEALVKIGASGINYIDVYYRTGQYPAQPPFTAGQEAAGIVESVGAGVEGIAAGDQVAYEGVLGSYAEYAVVPAHKLVPLPDGVNIHTAAAVLLQGMTAHYLTRDTYKLRSGRYGADSRRGGRRGAPADSDGQKGWRHSHWHGLHGCQGGARTGSGGR